MPSSQPRIQVIVDAELAAAMALVEPAPKSRARLVRDLALRGATVVAQERAEAGAALEMLVGIANGEIDYDFDAASALYSERGDRLP